VRRTHDIGGRRGAQSPRVIAVFRSGGGGGSGGGGDKGNGERRFRFENASPWWSNDTHFEILFRELNGVL
jgi:hypothetical protein